MHACNCRGFGAGVVVLGLIILGLFAVEAGAQSNPEIYTATVIASEGVVGSTSGRISIRITSYTTSDENTALLNAFKKSTADGMAALRAMSKGYINVEGQPGRKIEAAYSRQRGDGYDIVVIGEHMASKLEQWQGVKPENYPVAVLHMRFASDGTPRSGEIFPAARVAVTPDNYIDVQTDNSNKVTMINIARQQ